MAPDHDGGAEDGVVTPVTEEDQGSHAARSPAQAGSDREFGRSGWLLVAAIVVSFLLIPLVIVLSARSIISLPFRVTYLVLPLFPAVALALLAVWVTTTE